MPTIFRIGPYRFYFYASDRHEPIHVHVERDDKIAKYWIQPIRLQYSDGFNRAEIKKIQSIIKDNQEKIIEVWNEYFGG